MKRAALAFLLIAAPASALDLQVPGAVTLQDDSPFAIHHIATGPARDGTVPLAAHEGPATRVIWDIPDGDSTDAIFANLRNQIIAAGYDTTFTCATRTCGGYDFRFGIDVAPAPDMFVDLSDFHYFAGTRGDDVLSLIVSKNGGRFTAQMDTVGGTAPTVAPDAVKSSRLPLSEIGTLLRTEGVAVLEDLTFATGSSTLAAESYTSLTALAAHLAAHPGDAVALVGHTDAEGSLEANVALSQDRANAVRAFLINTLGVSEAQIAARGIGYLAPRASNLSPEGRARNRRVEVVLTAAE